MTAEHETSIRVPRSGLPTTSPSSEGAGSSRSRLLLATAAIALLFSFTGIFGHGLWTPDEPRVAEIGREMLMGRDFLVPHLGGTPFLEKPPLYWWSMVAAYRAFGVSDAAARLPSAVFGFLTVLLAASMARRMAGARAGLLAACVLVTLASFYHMHRATTDPALALFVCLGFWAFQRVAFPPDETEQHARPRAAWVILVYLAGGLAFLTKGVVGPVLLFGPIGIYVLAARRWDLLRSWAHAPGLVALGLLCAAWPIALQLRGGDALSGPFLVDNVLHRALPGAPHDAGHLRPPWYYLTAAPPLLLPWILAWPALYRWLFRNRTSPRALPRGLGFMALVLPIGVLLLSVPVTKRGLYLLPLMAPMAAATGVWLASLGAPERADGWERVARRALSWGAVLVLAVLAVAGVGTLLKLPLGAGVARVVHNPSAGLLAGLLLLSSGCVLAAFLFHLRRRGTTIPGLACAWCGAWLIFNLLGYRLVDPAKDLRPFVHDLASLGAFDAPLVGYRLDETTRAILPLYGRRDVPSYDESAALEGELATAAPPRLLMLERDRKSLSPSLQARLSLLHRWKLSKHRTYVLFDVARPGLEGSAREPAQPLSWNGPERRPTAPASALAPPA